MSDMVRVVLNANAVEAATKKLISQATYAGAKVVENRARKLLSTDGSGKVNGRRRRGVKPTRSQPGEPPFAQTKQLRQSVTTAKAGLTAMVGTPLMYGVYLEIGTSRMAARPWLRRSLEESRDVVIETFRRVIAYLSERNP